MTIRCGNCGAPGQPGACSYCGIAGIAVEPHRPVVTFDIRQSFAAIDRCFEAKLAEEIGRLTSRRSIA